MEDGEDFDSVRFDPIKDAIGKACNRRFANIGKNERMQCRIRTDAVERFLHPGRERHAQARRLVHVVGERLVELGLRLVAKDDREIHRRARASARALTTSQEVTASGRARLSARRRSSSCR